MVFAMDKRKRLNYRKSDVCRVLDGNFAELSLGGVFLHAINIIIYYHHGTEYYYFFIIIIFIILKKIY